MARVKEVYDFLEYLSVQAPLDKVDRLEDKQSRYIREYVKNKNYRIVASMRRNGLSQGDVDRQWERIISMISKKQIKGVVIANMAAVASDLPDAYKKVGQIIDAGGMIVTVDEGMLAMNIKEVR